MSFFRNHILFRKKRFHPDSIPNLGFWLESDYGITRDGSNAVSEWIARGSRGYTLSQATGANQPIWTANEFGSQAGLIFDGSNDSLERSVSNPFGDVQTFSYFEVCKSTTGTADENYVGMGDLGSTDSFIPYKGATAFSNAVVIEEVISGQLDRVRAATAINNNVQRLIILESNGSNWNIRLNRTEEVLTVLAGTNSGEAPGDWTTLDNIAVGMLRRNNAFFSIANFAAILFYERQLSAAERTRVENYLISKYGIAA